MALGQKLACPRCGEAFAITHLPLDDPFPIPSPEAAYSAEYRKPIRRNRLVGGLVMGGMLLMAAIGLAYALATVQMRRDHDRALPRQHRKPWLLNDGSTDAEPNVRPEALAGLGYLPATTGFVVGLQVEDLLSSPAGKSLRSRSWNVGNTEVSLGTLPQWIGLAIDDIEYVVVGVRDPDAHDVIPKVHVVIRTRRSDGANRIRVGMKATSGKEEKTPEGGKRTLYDAKIGALPARVWAADERTVVLGVNSDLKEVPGKPAPGIDHLPTEVREAIEKRLAAGVPFWAVGHSANWKDTWLPALLGPAKDLPLAGQIEQVRTFALGLVPTQPAKVTGAFRFDSEAVAARVAKQHLEPRQKADKGFKFSQAGPWIDVQQTFELGQK
jgi:hypothetical protein